MSSPILCGVCQTELTDANSIGEESVSRRRHILGNCAAILQAQRNEARAKLALVERTLRRALTEVSEVAFKACCVPARAADEEGGLVHVLFEGQPLCGFMPGTLPGDWPAGHHWISLVEHLVPEAASARTLGHRAANCGGCVGQADSARTR